LDQPAFGTTAKCFRQSDKFLSEKSESEDVEFVDAFRYTKAMGGYGTKVAKAIAARARRHLKESGN
jgi:hypothetical protein